MEYSTFTALLQQRILRMSHRDLLGFGLEICKRLYPDYAAFARLHHWGDADLLLDGIRECERSHADLTDLETIRNMRDRIDTIIPDTDDFGGFDGSCALNASAAVAYVLQFVLDKSAEHIQHTAYLYYDNTDLKLQQQGITVKAELECHPQMEEARRFLLGK